MSLTKVDSNEDPFQTATPGRKREFLSFLKTIRNFKGDLSSFTAPPFLLSPVSLIEHPSSWAEQPAALVAPASEPDPAKRALLILKWYLGSLIQQFGKQNRRKKKPLNPFLGELFLGKIEDETSVGITELVCEQVSHHPPVTAYRVANEKHGVHLYGYNAQKTYFSGTVRFERIGHVLVHYNMFEEDHVATLPMAHLEGLIPPPPYPELEGGSRIVSSSGFVTEIDFSGKGWFRGKKNSFQAMIYKAEEPAEVLYTAEGQWNEGSFIIRDAKNILEKVDTTATRQLPPLTVAPIEEQDPLESRRAWFKVARAIENGDMATVTKEKSRIEEEQRAMRKTELIEEREWQLRYFERADAWPEVERLLRMVGSEVERERTKGIWRWGRKKEIQE